LLPEVCGQRVAVDWVQFRDALSESEAPSDCGSEFAFQPAECDASDSSLSAE